MIVSICGGTSTIVSFPQYGQMKRAALEVDGLCVGHLAFPGDKVLDGTPKVRVSD